MLSKDLLSKRHYSREFYGLFLPNSQGMDYFPFAQIVSENYFTKRILQGRYS